MVMREQCNSSAVAREPTFSTPIHGRAVVPFKLPNHLRRVFPEHRRHISFAREKLQHGVGNIVPSIRNGRPLQKQSLRNGNPFSLMLNLPLKPKPTFDNPRSGNIRIANAKPYYGCTTKLQLWSWSSGTTVLRKQTGGC